MALRPALFLPVLASVLALGYGIEFLQPFAGRERDFLDAAANTVGVAIGAGVGLLARGLYAWMRRDLALAAVSRKRIRCRAGTVLLREGEQARMVHIIQSGDVKVSRTVNGNERELALLGPGDVFGLLGLNSGHSAIRNRHRTDNCDTVSHDARRTHRTVPADRTAHRIGFASCGTFGAHARRSQPGPRKNRVTLPRRHTASVQRPKGNIFESSNSERRGSKN
jgi:hypothetical protein